ncbi:hypothetical protein BKA61DRAFT_667584 [Leptodontidium sp. MPI-SDFR-AT-0119]|nr:hypothetical protein BKA61DRAFT_667584 [Leptodontidium sp. MPI-SDFR-AT-0119]
MVGVLAAGFHPIDQKRRDSIDPRQERSVLGNDIAGRVLQNVDRPRSSNPLLQGATRIFGQSRKSFDSGSLQEVALLDLDYAARIPDCITDNEAATLPSLAFAAYYYLFHHTTLAFDPPCACDSHQTPQTPQTQKMFASMANIQAIIAVGKIQSFEAMKAFGATHLLDVESLKTTDDIQAARSGIHTIAQGSSLCRIIDTTNWDVTLAASLFNTNTHGKIIGPFARYIDYSKVNRSHNTPRCVITCALYIDAHETGSFGHKFWENLPKWLDSRNITPSKCEILPGGLNAEMVNEKLDTMGNSDGTDWSNFIVRPGDDGTLVETPLMRRFLKSGELPTRGN